MRFLLILIFFCSSWSLWGHVLVSIPPQKYLVMRLAGDFVEVQEIVPRGVSPHSFEPTPRDLESVNGADLWFTCGEGFERRLSGALKGRVKMVSQLEGLDLIHAGCCCHSSGVDTHVWLSPKRLIEISKKMAHELSKTYPMHSEAISQNLASIIKELSTLDEQILQTQLTKTILVSHPAFSYFCQDYGIEQISIEVDGKEPSPKQASQLMEKLRERGLKTLYFQKQYHPKAAHRFASELSLSIHPLDPYEEDVIGNLNCIREAFRAL